MKSPDEIHQDAENAPERWPIKEHMKTIMLLKDKGYSLRHIAQFFQQKGINYDHNLIYRAMRRFQFPGLEQIERKERKEQLRPNGKSH